MLCNVLRFNMFINISFVILSCIIYTMYVLKFTIHHLIDIWRALNFWLLWIMLLWIFVCTSLCGYIFSLFSGKYLEVELFSHMLSICLFVRHCCTAFQNVCVFYIPTSNVWEFKCSKSSPPLLSVPFFFFHSLMSLHFIGIEKHIRNHNVMWLLLKMSVLLHFCHSSAECVVDSHCGFNLHFFDY